MGGWEGEREEEGTKRRKEEGTLKVGSHPMSEILKIPWLQNWSDWRGGNTWRLPREANTLTPPLVQQRTCSDRQQTVITCNVAERHHYYTFYCTSRIAGAVLAVVILSVCLTVTRVLCDKMDRLKMRERKQRHQNAAVETARNGNCGTEM